MSEKELLIKAKTLIKSKGSSIIKKYHANNISVGYKTEDGKITKKIAIIFYVDKNDKQSIEAIKNIPKEIDGIPTDVVKMESGFKLR